MTTRDPGACIPAAPGESAHGDYVRGFRAAVAAMRILAPGLTCEQFQVHATREATAGGPGPLTDYAHGVRDAFKRWIDRAAAHSPRDDRHTSTMDGAAGHASRRATPWRAPSPLPIPGRVLGTVTEAATELGATEHDVWCLIAQGTLLLYGGTVVREIDGWLA